MEPRFRHGILVPALSIALLGCAGGETGRPAAELFGLLPPAADLPGWTVADGPVEYSPGTLYEYLNGGAERYDSHGFRKLVHIRYQLGDNPLACVTLDLYDMSTDLGAFGIYAAGRPKGHDPRPWGVEGYRRGTIAAAYRGSVFVHGEADDDREELVEMLEYLVSGAADAAPGATTPPSILAHMPTEHRVPGSERYVPEDLLGHSFLPGGVIAIYEIDDRRAELFFTDLDAETAAINAMAALRVHFDERGAIAGGSPAMGDDGFRTAGRIFGQGTVVRADLRIAGIHGELPIEEREGILRILVDSGIEESPVDFRN